MAGLFSSFNKSRLFEVDTTDFEYKSLEELYAEFGPDEIYTLRGIWINSKGLYGDAPVAATDEFYVNFPAHMTGATISILGDKKCVAAINNGKCGFRIVTYVKSKYNKTCYSIEWVDID